jgi:hypothetical protein
MRKTPESRVSVRCAISVERGRVLFDPESGRPEALLSKVMEGSPRFHGAADEGALQRILETVHEGMKQVRQGGTEGFTLCPVVTERMSYEGGRGELEVVFCTALWTFLVQGARSNPAPLESLCQDYFSHVLLPFVGQSLVTGLEGAGEVEEEACLWALHHALADLGERFPLAPYQHQYGAALERSGNAVSAGREVSERMIREARLRLGLRRATGADGRRGDTRLRRKYS